jgi:NAD(P)-dependent dehydrogenase (short-subunit alcohol dehydrogenase family)
MLTNQGRACVWSSRLIAKDVISVGLLDGKVAVITGAGNGIGRSEALALAAHGVAIVVNDLDQAADLVVAEIVAAGGRSVANYADVSSWQTTSDLVTQAVDEFGGLDIVVTSAGINRRSRIIDVDEAEFDAQVAVLFKGTYGLIRDAGAYWRREYDAGVRKHRTIVATSSSAGVPGGVQDFSVYAAMKAGVAAVTLGAALEFRSFGATVNAILPHAATRMDAVAKGLADFERFEPGDPNPMNPQHVANVVAYLASERAAWLTGQVFEITGTNVRRWVTWAPAGEVESAEQWTAAALDDALATTVYHTLPGGRVIPKK